MSAPSLSKIAVLVMVRIIHLATFRLDVNNSAFDHDGNICVNTTNRWSIYIFFLYNSLELFKKFSICCYAS